MLLLHPDGLLRKNVIAAILSAKIEPSQGWLNSCVEASL
jgi:hypothetical protein